MVKEDEREEVVVVEEKSERVKPWNIKRRLKEWMDEDEVGVREWLVAARLRGEDDGAPA